MNKSCFLKKKVLLGITGGIAAYKSIELARLLQKRGAEVKVVMTKNAKEFIHPNSFEAITNNRVMSSLFEASSEISHVSLAKWADILIIAPATASIIGKLAAGVCDDLLTTLCMATSARIIVVPSMNMGMWENGILQDNLKKLQHHNYEVVAPAIGGRRAAIVVLAECQSRFKLSICWIVKAKLLKIIESWLQQVQQESISDDNYLDRFYVNLSDVILFYYSTIFFSPFKVFFSPLILSFCSSFR